MTDEPYARLDEIEGRLKAATPWPWKAERGGDFQSVRLHRGTLTLDIWDGSWNTPDGNWRDSADIDLVEKAPEDIAWLIELARKQDAALQGVCDELGNAEGLGRGVSPNNIMNNIWKALHE